MSTERQIAANRLNAQKSTGPRTEEGRAAVRLNAVKHGLCAKTLVLPGEDEAGFQAVFDGLEETYQPANYNEMILVRQMAMAAWRLDRAYHVEGAFFHYELKDDAQIRDQYHPGLDLYSKLAYLHHDESNDRKLSLQMRYQAHLERSYHRAMSALERLQAKRTATVRERPSLEPAQEIGSVSQKRKQPIPINEITNIEPKPAPEAEPESPQPTLNSRA